MPIVPLDISADSYVSQSSSQASRRCINVYKQVEEGETLSPYTLIGSPGTSLFCDLPDNSCRALIDTKNRVFSVNNESIYEIFSDGSYNLISSVILNNTENTIIRWATNGYVVCLITDGAGYFLNLDSDSLEEITDPVFSLFGNVIDVRYKDGYFFYLTEDYIFNGSLVTDNNGKSFTALSFGSAEIEPDGNVGSGVLNNQYYVFGKNSIESFNNIGGVNFPLQRIEGATIQKGCLAKDTIINFQGALSFLGEDRGESPSLYLLQGSQIAKLSTPAMDAYIQSLDEYTVSNAFCWVYQNSGSNFLVFEVGYATFVYDATATAKSGRAIWHERQSGHIKWDGYKTWRSRLSVTMFGKILVGDKETGKIGFIDYDSFTEYDGLIHKGIQSQHFDGKYSALSQIEVFCDVGVGNSLCENPSLFLSYSDDMCNSFSTPVSRSLGRLGDYRVRVFWNRLGRITRPRTLRFFSSDPFKLRISKVEAFIE